MYGGVGAALLTAAVFGTVACGSNTRGGNMAGAALDASPDTNMACELGETAVSVQVDGGTLYGTQAMPVPCPARAMAVIIGGSGPVDRNVQARWIETAMLRRTWSRTHTRKLPLIWSR
jgi:hypothetical protein